MENRTIFIIIAIISSILLISITCYGQKYSYSYTNGIESKSEVSIEGNKVKIKTADDILLFIVENKVIDKSNPYTPFLKYCLNGTNELHVYSDICILWDGRNYLILQNTEK